jgi:drug/metabolite transporter (DMT)-like permease
MLDMELASILALMAAFCFAAAATLQQKGALALGEPGDGGSSLLWLAKSKWWLIGTGALLVGYLLQAIALDNGRLSIIQPLLVTTVVFALPMGYYLTDQVVGRREVIGAIVVVLGLALYAVFGDPAAGNDTAPNDEWLIALTAVTVICGALFVAARRATKHRKASLLGITSGILYGTSACLVKQVTTQLNDGGVAEVLENWQFWAMSVAGIVAFVIQQMSLREGFLATSVATVSVANPIISIIIGILLFDEALSEPTWHKLVAWIGLGLGMLGAVVISEGQGTKNSEANADPGSPGPKTAPAGS